MPLPKNTIKNTLKNEPAEAEEPKKKRRDDDKPRNEPREKKKRVKNEEEKIPKKRSNPFAFLADERLHKIVGLALILMSVYMLVAFTSFIFTWKADFSLTAGSWKELLSNNTILAHNWLGKFGAIISQLFIYNLFGIASYVLIPLFFTVGLKLFLNIELISIPKLTGYCIAILLTASVIFGYFFIQPKHLFLCGAFGYHSNLWLTGMVGRLGTFILLLFAVAGLMIAFFNTSFDLLKRLFGKRERDEETEEETMRNRFVGDETEEQEEEDEYEPDGELTVTEKPVVITSQELQPDLPIDLEPVNTGEVEFTINMPVDSDPFENIEPTAETEKTEAPMGDYDPTLDLSRYQYPGTDLLTDYGTGSSGVKKEELEANKNRIIKTLNDYGIKISRIAATIGPTVTLYEIVPEAGVKISRIKNLEDDIALSLSALGIRIIAPIPGKGTIGIEVPNQTPETVSIKSVLESEKFVNSTFDLPIALGKTIANEVYVADLAKMPHLLIAGATGQGKSVGLNAVIVSLLYKKHPSQLKFVLVDPKKVEMPLFAKIERHYLAKLPDLDEPIITDVKQVLKTLTSLCIEMDQRYDLLKAAEVRNIKEYNGKFVSRRLNPNDGHRYLPYIVLVVDEFADLIVTAGREVETPIARLAQLARAVGIHLIIATQRPTTNIITGTIKANFPARIAFRVSSKIDSRTILDSNGADQLIGRGDMLLSTGNDLVRIQCAFIDTPEVCNVAEFIGAQQGYPSALLLPEVVDESGNGEGASYDSNDRDSMFEDAARCIVMHQQGSTSLLQRKLKLGYNRAGRLIDQLEAAGIVGPFEGSKAREVRIKDEMSLEQLLSSLSNKSNN
ncbi:MAG: DNA translocase FtsK 4TM domain-containing protein [Bacteroidota bacterium]